MRDKRRRTPAPEDLARRWWRTVYGVALSLTGRAADAEDLTQEAFLRAFRSLRSLRDPQRAGPWLVAIVRNAARDRLRQTRPAPLGDSSERLADDAPEAIDDDAVVPAWRRLPDEERLVVWLKIVDGMTIREVAHLVGTSKSAADRTLRRGLARLAKEVTRC